MSWTDVPGSARSNYAVPGSRDPYFVFSSPVTTGRIRMLITGRGSGQNGASFAEFAAYGSGPTSNRVSVPVIVSTTNPTDDAVVADYIATDQPFGADPTGAADSTAAIQHAIDDAFAAGGGTVWLPAGTYKVTGTIEVDPYVTLRGDWRDPDTGSGSYGTVISAQVPSGASGPVVFEMRGDAATVGLTVFYPSQNPTNPVPYNYTFRAIGTPQSGFGGHGDGLDTNLATYLIQKVTLLNSYRGIGLSPAPYTRNWHQTALVRDVKGTVLNRGMTAINASNVDMMRDITFTPKYWSQAGSAYNAPAAATIAAQTRANAVAFEFASLEQDQFVGLTASDVATGLQLVPGPRTRLSALFENVSITDATVAVDAQELDERCGIGFTRSVLQGSTLGIRNTSGGYVKISDTTVTGGTSGDVRRGEPAGAAGTSPAPPAPQASPSVTRRVLYNAVLDYSAPSTAAQTSAPTVDATAAIQNAISAASAAGGGVVYLRAGWYLIAGHLTVPANVELRGASPAARDNPGSSRGTVLWVTEGRDTADPDGATAAVTLTGAGSGMRSLRIFHPASNPADGDGVNRYPFAIRLSGTGQYLTDIGLIDAYNGIDAAGSATDGHLIRDIQGSVLNRGIVVRTGSGGTGWVDTVSIDGGMSERTALIYSPDWTGRGIRGALEPYAKTHLAIVEVQGTSTSQEQVTNVFGYSTQQAVHVTSGRANIVNAGVDILGGYTVSADSGATAVVSNLLRVFGSGDSSGTVTVFSALAIT